MSYLVGTWKADRVHSEIALFADDFAAEKCPISLEIEGVLIT